MDNLEAGRLVAPDGGDLSVVPRPSLFAHVLHGNVRYLKDRDRQRQLLVLSDRLEQSREKRSSHHLVLDRLGVGQGDGKVPGVGSVEERKVLVVRALQVDEASMISAVCFHPGAVSDGGE